MIPTPKNHLPKGYPLPEKKENERYQPVFKRAFEIHETAHDFCFGDEVRDRFGILQEFRPRHGILSPVKGRTKLSKAHYCDCYEQAYQELKDKI